MPCGDFGPFSGSRKMWRILANNKIVFADTDERRLGKILEILLFLL